MREIKFRVLKEKGMNYFYLSDIHAGGAAVYSEPEFCDINDCNIMQFVGMKDKHKNDIYEGDICRNDEDEIGIVVFHEGTFVLELINTFDPMCLCNYISLIEEVIGNKYQNPELLK